MTTPSDAARPRPSLAAAKQSFRLALRDMVVLLVVVLVLGVGVGALVAGAEGVWGALLGVAIALVFSGTTVVSVLRTADDPPARAVTVIMGLWLAKLVLVFVVLAVLSRFDFYSRPVLGVVLIVGVVGSAYLDLRAVQRTRAVYTDADPVRPPGSTSDGGPDLAGS
ncbi:hypothetical protein [Cellulomonas alba]|uniref:ATP synthase protein I n=1 Tax=Cellulomonas alba TaxID=3053467 RepID=A0ABT7SHU2_9CELL|nr:hypothetical protein [Cellulomonas alba]MDM7855762.1 hypothetical protein [Cellulomonas alba]